MIQPINGHLLIQPVVHESFMSQQQGTFQEIGVVLALPQDMIDWYEINSSSTKAQSQMLRVGDRVYFDAWLAAKYPTGKDEFYWLVKYEDVRAIEHAEPK